ncbi:MAG: HAD family hydrolase [Planctomycetota bacterium]
MLVDVLLFDWGGTLADVSRQAEFLRRGAMEAVGVIIGTAEDEPVERLIKAIVSAESRADADPSHREADISAVVADWSRSLGVSDSERISAACHALGQAWVGSLDLLPGVRDTLGILGDRGYRMGLVSNCPVGPPYCHQEIVRQGLDGLLDFTVLSSVVGYRKPSPVIYEQALGQAYPGGRPDDLSGVLFIGDSPAYDVIVPAGMGMKTALVTHSPFSWPKEDYAKAKPDLRINSVSELPAILDH